ncbi:hypothetical protein EV383_3736 [Pseudonocardia sediminis]|uniref:Uncharacterized protein n=1 Tax=Pseudonocardia sediminis TaxID=1397368 RepID=A0A4Q7UXN3_PSEST|nr:hypothetical protein EV383_3736 [Pseudonocardia sediminis]
MPVRGRRRGAGQPAATAPDAGRDPGRPAGLRAVGGADRDGRRRVGPGGGAAALRGPGLAGRRRVGGPSRSARGSSAVLDGRRRVPAVHLRLDRRPEGRAGDARQPHREPGDDPPRLRPRPRLHGRRLGAVLPRPGPDRQRPAAAARRRDGGPDVADDVRPASDAVAEHDLGPPGAHQRRAELRLRRLCRRRGPRRPRGPGPEQLAGRVQRGRTRPSGHAAPLRRDVRPVRVRPGGTAPLLRPGGGDADRHRNRPGPRPAHRRGGPGRARPRSLPGRGTGPRPDARRVRPGAARCGRADRPPGHRSDAAGRGGRRDPGDRAARRAGLPGPAGRHRLRHPRRGRTPHSAHR